MGRKRCACCQETWQLSTSGCTRCVHVQVAVQWQKISAGDWTAYAADVSRRSSINPGPAAEAGP
jgi:hypothetical protein